MPAIDIRTLLDRHNPAIVAEAKPPFGSTFIKRYRKYMDIDAKRRERKFVLSLGKRKRGSDYYLLDAERMNNGSDLADQFRREFGITLPAHRFKKPLRSDRRGKK